VTGVDIMTRAEKKKARNDLIRELSPEIFWDVVISRLDVDQNKDLIIERVLTRGREKDEILLWKMYSYRVIKNVTLNLYELNDLTVRYMSFVLGVKEEKFRCYGKIPWNRSC